ncbi:MAG: hypothetical protein HBSAPP03_18420 [Phycisphaerae bacterium]|nr:MAG: hypothetical protein HBSAPP03_18420 [Phycisphaerae bacterium]
MNTPTPYTRREFLRTGLVMASAAATLPSFLNASALAMHRAAGGLSSIPGVPEEHILVVIQLGGGNDGLNTVVPYFAPEYYKARPGINIPEAQVLKLSGADGVGLHPQMAALREMYDDGLVGVVQGVGYPNPNRSHFKSMDIWHTADTTATGDGWLGRYFDSECCGFGKGESGTADAGASGGPPGIAIGRSAPLAMEGRTIKPVAFESADLFKWSAAEMGKELREGYQALNSRTEGEGQAARANSNASFLLRTALDAQVSSDMIRRAVATRPTTQFPGSDLGRQLSMISSMIGAGLKTRVYYASMGSFDTHAGQGGPQGRHGQLLSQFSQAVRAFYQELKAQGNDQRVMSLAFSEFGRRVGQNQSQGTDHGTAAPMFTFGPMVRRGVIGDHPSLKNLDDGDLKYGIDFRSVYAGVLESWLKADSKAILEGTYQALPVVASAATSPASRVKGR